jgi:cytochrome c
MKEPQMNKTPLVLASIAVAIASAPVLASPELAAKNGCTACHAVDKKLVGPAFKDVAAKYRGDAKAPAYLADKVKKGSVGVWGQVPMPPNTQAKDEDVNALVKWILSLK